MSNPELCFGMRFGNMPECAVGREDGQLLVEGSPACAECLGSMALKDQLTDLPNRYMLNGIFKDMVVSEKPFGAIGIDICNFGEVNNLFDHEYGDEMLVNTARYLEDQTRKYDVIGAPVRRGGDEFTILARLVSNKTRKPKENPGDALYTMAGRIQQNYLEDPLINDYNLRDQVVIAEKPISLRYGASVYIPGQSLCELVAAADPKAKVAS